MVHVFADKAHQSSICITARLTTKSYFSFSSYDILVRGAHIGEFERIGHGLCHFNFLTDGVE